MTSLLPETAIARDFDWHEFLRDLVATPSLTGQTDTAVQGFVRAARIVGLKAWTDEAGNGIAVAGAGPIQILLVGHIDTVPGDLPVELESGWLTGRGSVDAKGPLAAFLRAAAHFRDDERIQIVVVACCDEEGPSHGARALLRRFQPAAVVIGEPSNTTGVTLGYRGVVRMRLVVEGDMHHSGDPHPTPPEEAIAFWNGLSSFLTPFSRQGLFESATARLTSIDTEMVSGGRVRVRLDCNVRTPIGFDIEELKHRAVELAGHHELTIFEALSAHMADKRSHLARALVVSIRGEGLEPRFVKKTGTSDMNVLSQGWACPFVAYGPGDSSLDHTPQERLSMADFDMASRILVRALDHLGQEAARERGSHS